MDRGDRGTRPGRLIAKLLVLAVLTGACATPRIAPVPDGHGRAEPELSRRYETCTEEARKAESSRAFRAAIGAGALAGALMMLYGAAEGAWWGVVTGGSRSEGAWIGAAAGAGIGLVVGIAGGVEKARQAGARYAAAVERCLEGATAGEENGNPDDRVPEDPD
jgi:hypothetical protein